jgi:hypothetical protein
MPFIRIKNLGCMEKEYEKYATDFNDVEEIILGTIVWFWVRHVQILSLINTSRLYGTVLTAP